MNIKTVIFISKCSFSLATSITAVAMGIPSIKRVFKLDNSKKKQQEITPSNDITEDETREDDEK